VTQSSESHEPAVALSEAMKAIHRRGWCEGTGGNFSCVISRSPTRLLMAPSGVDKGSVRPEDLLLVDGSGQVIQGEGRASAETLLHLAIVETTGAGAVLHTHSQAGTLLSGHYGPSHRPDPSARREGDGPEQVVGHVELMDLEMLKGLEGIQTHATIVKIPVLANDQNLERLSRSALPHLHGAPHGLLIAGHGLYAWGKDLPQARRHLEILEFLLEQHWRSMLLQAIAPVEGSR
jgi:methylthioribulose-1-phosphate dehydratase